MSQCPYAALAQLRAQAPASEIAPGVWRVTRHAEVLRVLREPQVFSAVITDGNEFALFGPSPVQDEIDRIMADYPERPALMRIDPPEQLRMRALLVRALAPSVVQGFEPMIRQQVRSLSAGWLDRGQVEFVGDFADILPGAVTTDFICGEPQMRERFKFWAGEIMSRAQGPMAPERQLEVAHNIAAMGRYFLDAIAARRQQPGHDLISLIVQAEPADGVPLEDVAIVNVLETFMVGGNETTTFLLGNAWLRLAREPELAARLRAAPQLIAAFVEEMLRLEPPAQNLPRKTTQAVELGGVQLPKGAMVLASLASANRDERAFAQADQLDLERTDVAKHLAFGNGNHLCLGLQLARAEARIALEELLPRMQDIELVDDVEWLHNDFLRGPVRLGLRFKPAIN